MELPRIDSQTLDYRRTHNLLLASRLFTQRDHHSPFTLILDSANQSSVPLVLEYVSRAVAAKIRVILVSFQTSEKLPGVDVLINGRRKTPKQLQDEILKAVQGSTQGTKARSLVVLDTLHPILQGFRRTSHSLTAATPPGINNMHISSFLGSLLSPTTTLLATVHTDVPITMAMGVPSSIYSPEPMSLLNYLATTLITVYAPAQVFEHKSGMDRSQPTPRFGVAESREGVLMGLGSNSHRLSKTEDGASDRDQVRSTEGVVFELEHRRKSGRGMVEWFYLSPTPIPSSNLAKHARYLPEENIILLEDHPRYSPLKVEQWSSTSAVVDTDDVLETTFSLGLTEKQKNARDQVVLPYFDAQKDGGGMGGRILYTPGREDDWDEEEDEI